ncbi:MAG: hypothetical protein SRB2_03039 [Desulfobacteraceae bacterium Eth-SRB2]|nr:MAG: hypothetical protein SRB2_03039 [Desulfobacteraceae bacterium Eth-SRB2]
MEELALHKTHLDKARADLAAARSRQCSIFKRTHIMAPFNAMSALPKTVDLGSQGNRRALAELGGNRCLPDQTRPYHPIAWDGLNQPNEAISGSTARIIFTIKS